MRKSMIHPPDTSGGGGFTFEDAATAIYLAALIGAQSAPGLEGRIVSRVAVQQAIFGEPLDDLIVDGAAPDQSIARLSLQSKREVTISAAASNTDFREVVSRSWKTLLKPDFREGIDRVAVVTGTVSEDARRALQDVCEWARFSTTSQSFHARFHPGGAGSQRRDVLDTFRTILANDVGRLNGDADVHRVLQHFVLVKLDVLHEGATDDAHAIERLRSLLIDLAQADSLWDRLRVLARDADGRAGEFDRASLLLKLRGSFGFKSSAQIGGEMIVASDPNQTNAAVLSVADPKQGHSIPEKLKLEELRQIAAKLLAAGAPPSFLPLFPDASSSARQALEQFARLARTVTQEPVGSSTHQKTIRVTELFAQDQLHHLLLAVPGSGKTHGLWVAAHQLLSEGGPVPIFIPVGRLATWDDAARAVTDVANGIDLAALLRDSRVCVVLDGWSEFASRGGGEERTRVLRVLSRTRVIANGRRSMGADTRFRIWRLNPPPVSSVLHVIKTARPESPPPASELLELLRLPLALSLFILLGGSALSRGELITRLHDHLSRNLPESFRSILAGAVASIILSRHGRSYVRLEQGLRERATQAGLANPIQILQELGTLEDRSGTVLPVHDLYWSWLAGLGLLEEDRIADSLPNLTTRECYELALESGARPGALMVATACKTDVTLAGLFSSELQGHGGDEVFRSMLTAMFSDQRLPVKCRAALAALGSGRADLVRSALDVFAEIRRAKLYIAGFESAFNPKDLFLNRGIVAEWLGASGTDELIDAVASRGDADWGTWLEQMGHSGKLPMPNAAAATMACVGRVPDWTVPYLSTLIHTQAWKLRAVAARGTNLELANWIADHYDQFSEPSNSKWFELNKMLVACGDDGTFERLLSRFPSMSLKAQETLGFAIVDRGEPWIARFQKSAFESGALTHHHQLLEVVSLGIDDGTARRWISRGPTVLGWRVLIARHGGAMVAEMVANLPSTFDGLQDCPVLSAMRFLPPAPESLTDEIMKRIRGNMQPKVMQDAINALARVKQGGLLPLVALVAKNPSMLPTYHLAQLLGLLKDWEQGSNQTLIARSNLGATSFVEWILVTRLPQDKNDTKFRQAISRDRDLAVRIILHQLRDDERAIKAILEQIEPMESYHDELFELLLANQNLSTLIPKLFAGAFDTFPEKALVQALDAPGVQFGELLRCMSTSSSPVHYTLHKTIVTIVLALPIDLFRYRDVAKILRIYQREPIVGLLKSAIPEMTANSMWLVREIELERRELLIDEEGNWLE